MENWGLITGKTMNLLHDAERSGMQGKRMVVSTVSHEAALVLTMNLASSFCLTYTSSLQSHVVREPRFDGVVG